MPLILPVDAESLVVDYLAHQADVVALGAGGTDIPANPSWPRWRLTKIGGSSVYPGGWVEHPRFQIESWGSTDAGGKASALLLARTIEAALWLLPGRHSLGVVSAYVLNLSQRWLPDSADNQRPRYQSDFTITVHPNPV